MSPIERIIELITTGVGLTVLGVMPVLIVIDVFTRNVFGSGFPATTEVVSRYLIIVISFLPIAYAEIQRRHIEASIFTDMLPQVTKPLIAFIGFVLSTIVYAALTWGTALEAMRKTERGAYIEAGVIEFSVWPGYWILPFCYGLMVIVLLLRLSQVLTGRFR